MIPKAEGFLNRLSIVKLPRPRDLFSRFGNANLRSVQVADGTPLLAQRKNDLCDEINSEAANYTAPEKPSDPETE